MTELRRNPAILSLLVIAVTIVLVAVALIVGRSTGEEPPVLVVGQPSPQQFIATETISVEDAAATDQQRTSAYNSIETIVVLDPGVDIAVANNIRTLFVDGLLATRPLEPGEVLEGTTTTEPTTTTTEAPTTTTTLAEGEVPIPTEPPTTTTTTLPPATRDEQIARLTEAYGLRLQESTIVVLVDLIERDAVAVELGEERVYDDVERSALEVAAQELADPGILPDELDSAQNDLRENPPIVSVPALGPELTAGVSAAISDIVATWLQSNARNDFEETASQREEAAAAVPPVTVVFLAGQEIVGAAQTLSAVQLDAIEMLDLQQPEAGESLTPIAVLGALAVLLTAFVLWRIATSQWSEPKHFALLGVLLVLAAATSRLPEIIVDDNPQLAYVLPMVIFGYLAAILYDPRTAMLMAVPIAIFTAVSTGDAALTIYAAAATVAPVAFVSAVSSRRQLRVAVALSALVLAPMAFAIAWLFTGIDTALAAAFFAVLGGVLGGLVAQGLLSFLENTFRVTTTLTLLDLTDRNHPALRLIEEKAPGTFNHSILVGTLAGKAARSIGADPLLAQSAAFYHDLGKTENPHFYIENQFGVSNPHDELDTDESVRLIRQHVTDGLRLARRYRLPPEVVAGIRQHHGDGLMRYFYHKALAEDPAVDPAMYRHAGEKPKSKEMAILMIADSCEGAVRALVQQEDPTPDNVKKVVDSVVTEKLEDGQFDESALTFGDLTNVKQAMVDALIGYYHTRIPYPDFPGTPAGVG